MADESTQLDGAVKATWRSFLELYEPLRPELYRYCRHLTRSAWDAEDMAQDALARAFVTLGCLKEPPSNPRAWLFRVASNLWLNTLRRPSEVVAGDPETPQRYEQPEQPEPRAAREAAGTLLAQLSPQERAAVVLKEAFDLSLEEVAEALGTSVGAIKAALHRARGKLLLPELVEPPSVVPAVLDAFCAAFNARDLPSLTALLLDGACMEYPGLLLEQGRTAVSQGSLYSTIFGCPQLESPAAERCEVRSHRGEPILLWWWKSEVHAILRVQLAGDRIAGLRNHHHAPDLMTEICTELGVPFRTHGYRFPA
jgi:RNA polymerase sigma-70 factor (ECF subfamily)